jgi:XTP/dITP diphosphohydrolase
MEILLASNNSHKRKEMDGILRGLAAPVAIVQPGDLGFSVDIPEHGRTFGENAFAKAEALGRIIRGEPVPGVTLNIDPREIASRIADRFGTLVPPVLADDSGICVHALDNRPGVYSARYGNAPDKPQLDDEQRNSLLLQELASYPDRTAHYVCNAVLYFDGDRYYQTQETWSGEIAERPFYGETGFGYDPIFYIFDHGSTVAQIPQEQKDRISHRAKAVSALACAAGWVGPS